MKYELDKDFQPFEDIAELFEKDKYLLFLLVFLEIKKDGRTSIKLSELSKNINWEDEDFTDSLPDVYFTSNNQKVFCQAETFYEYSHLGFFTSVGIENYENTVNNILIYFHGNVTKEELDNNAAGFFQDVIGELLNYAHARKIELEKRNNKIMAQNLSEDEFRKYRDIVNKKDIYYTKDERYFDKLQDVIVCVPRDIIINIQINNKGFEMLEKRLNEYLDKFIKNDYFMNESHNKIRENISTQVDSFIQYINYLRPLNGYVDVPFSIMQEKGFEAIKLIKYLEIDNKLKTKWLDEDSLKLKFASNVIDESIFFKDKIIQPKEKSSAEKEKLKFSLSFSPLTAIMSFKDQHGIEHRVKVQGRVQKDVLRVIFENENNAYKEWSLYEISDILGGASIDEDSVNNAIYNFNKKVKDNVPEIKKLFYLDKHSTKLNIEYVNKT